MKAVCTTFGCCAAAAAPTAGAGLPVPLPFGVLWLLLLLLWWWLLLLLLLLSVSPFAKWDCACVWCVGVRCCRSVVGAARLGGPMAEVDEGVRSIGSRGGASAELEEGRMGMDLCMFGLCSPENGL